MPKILTRVINDRWVRMLALGLAIILAIHPGQAQELPRLVDWQTVGAIAGLLILAKALELSGYLDVAARWILAGARSHRQLALGLILFSALAAAWVTNDVALFIVLPLTLAAARMTTLPLTRLITFEALAVNAGSSLTAIGNPQNLFLWHLSGLSLWGFTLEMLPLSAALLALVMLLACGAFPGSPLGMIRPRSPRLNPELLGLSVTLYVAFLAAMELGWIWPALLLVSIVFLTRSRSVLRSTDWALVVIFILVFADFRSLAQWQGIAGFLQSLPLEGDRACFLATIAGSQLVSNVPATITLAGFTDNWPALAFGANVGGFGLALGSLANLIALRATPDKAVWRIFHLHSLLALAIAIPLGLLVLLFTGK